MCLRCVYVARGREKPHDTKELGTEGKKIDNFRATNDKIHKDN